MDRDIILEGKRAWLESLEKDQGSEKTALVKVDTQPQDTVADLDAETCKSLGHDPDNRILAYTFSSEARDRDGDRILVRGWNLKSIRKNGPALWAHNRTAPPIGQILQVHKELGPQPRLRGLIKFAEPEVYPFADTIFQLAFHGYLKASSVGFIPEKYEIDPEDTRDVPDWTKGILFQKQELIEHSIVPIPSNPEALQEAKSFHKISMDPVKAWAEEVLDSPGLLKGSLLSREFIEKTYATIQTKSSLHIGDVDPLDCDLPELKIQHLKEAMIDLAKSFESVKASETGDSEPNSNTSENDNSQNASQAASQAYLRIVND